MSLERYGVIKAEATSRGLSTTSPRLADRDADASFLAATNARDQDGPVPVEEAIADLITIDKWVSVSTEAQSKNLLTRLDITLFSTIDMTDAAVIRDVGRTTLTSGEQRGFLDLGLNRRTTFEIAGAGLVQPRDLGRMRIESDKGLI